MRALAYAPFKLGYVRNRLITKTDALLQAESYQYDPAGEVVPLV